MNRKTIIAGLVLVLIVLITCCSATTPRTNNLQTVEHDGCEYVVLRDYGYTAHSGITHKGNCRYCNKR